MALDLQFHRLFIVKSITSLRSKSVGEASLRQMFVNARAFVCAHQWVLVVLGLSLLPPPLIKKPDTSPYLQRLKKPRRSFFVSQPLSMHTLIYIKPILSPTLRPTRFFFFVENRNLSVNPSRPPRQGRAPARHGKSKSRCGFSGRRLDAPEQFVSMFGLASSATGLGRV